MRSWAMALAWIWALALPAAAQDGAYLQVEAQPSIAQARAAAVRYAAAFDAVVGYALGSGWYAIALGPFDDRAAADAARRSLRASGQVPSDAFVVEAARTAARIWPDDVAPLPQATAPAPAEPEETLAQAQRAEAQLDRDTRAAVQSALAWFGHYDLAIDASFGPGTRRAMAEWQAAQGLDPTGVLTTAQRTALLTAWEEARAAYGFAPWRDETAGIEVTLPKALVAFDRLEAPFLRFAPLEDSGVEVLLISQEGTPATLAGLYGLLQTLDAMPAEGPRSLGRDRFTLSGQDAGRQAHAEARYARGQVKGFVLIWPADQPAAMDRALAELQASFRSFGPALPADAGSPPSTVPGAELVAGLDLRRPARTLSGFFIDATGRVLTSAALAEGCTRLTIEGRHPAEIALRDDGLGVALLTPSEPLAPPAYARFAPLAPAAGSDIVLAGFSLPGMSAPVLTTGLLAALEGLDGAPDLRRLTLHADPAEAGGPVMDRSGAVLGMLLPPSPLDTRILPEGISFAAGAEALAALLRTQGIAPTLSDEGPAMDPAALARTATGMTVQIACWK